MPIRPDDLCNPQRRRATLRSETAESDLIASFESLLGPAESCQMVRTGEFPLPFLDATLFINYFKEDHDVRIYELKVRNRALDLNGFRCVVCGVPVMGKHG